MVEEPKDGQDPKPLDQFRETYRGFLLRVYCDGGSFVAKGGTTLCRRSSLAPGEQEFHVEALAATVLSAAMAMQMGRERIDSIYEIDAEAVLRQGRDDSFGLPAWVPDDEFLARREKEQK